MTRMLLLCTLLASAAARAEDATLTKQEIKDGWLLLFDGKTTYGWTKLQGPEPKVERGGLTLSKNEEGMLRNTTPFASYELTMEYLVEQGGQLEVRVQTDAEGGARYSGQKHTTFVREGWGRLVLVVDASGAIRKMTETVLTGPKKNMGLASLVKDGRGQPRSGYLALKGKSFRIRSIKLKPRETESIFNGKDLTGWKIIPDRKSKFTVTDQGELRVVDGPGDIQTIRQWDDFVLQLECKTNGKHLNSGVFFRCLPDQYQQGYEAQIHNGFFEDMKKTYTLNVYPPIDYERGPDKTIKKGEPEPKKVQVESSAMDFGTGGIYRRSLARLQAAKDQEWFTMTVVAQGQQLATWVNGIQVTEWTDYRPLAENARKGCYLKKGVISLQGHDPMTDLLFRNFRIASLPKIPRAGK